MRTLKNPVKQAEKKKKTQKDQGNSQEEKDQGNKNTKEKKNREGKIGHFRGYFAILWGDFNLWRLSPKNNLKRFLEYL